MLLTWLFLPLAFSWMFVFWNLWFVFCFGMYKVIGRGIYLPRALVLSTLWYISAWLSYPLAVSKHLSNLVRYINRVRSTICLDLMLTETLNLVSYHIQYLSLYICSSSIFGMIFMIFMFFIWNPIIPYIILMIVMKWICSLMVIYVIFWNWINQHFWVLRFPILIRNMQINTQNFNTILHYRFRVCPFLGQRFRGLPRAEKHKQAI